MVAIASGSPSQSSRPGLAAAIVRLFTDHAYADMVAKGGHDLVHERFCVELMVYAIEVIHDEGAGAVRFSEVAAAVGAASSAGASGRSADVLFRGGGPSSSPRRSPRRPRG
jgi:hypothetical protein